MANYTTIVIRVPDDPTGKQQIFKALRLLDPYQRGISLEDELTFLECITHHEKFDHSIIEDAKAKMAELHAFREHEEK